MHMYNVNSGRALSIHCPAPFSDVNTVFDDTESWRQLFVHLKTIRASHFVCVQCLPAQVQWGPQQSLLQPPACLQPTALTVWPWRNWPLGLGTGVSVCRGKHTKINEWCECVCLCIFIITYLSSCHSSNLVSGSSSLQEYPIFTAVSTRMKKEGRRKDREEKTNNSDM